jgi:hypothetical protein
MGKISSYGTASAPSLGDKLIGTSVGGSLVNGTYNFTIQQLADLISGQITLQEVLTAGNTATQSINLTGVITATSLIVGNITSSGTITSNGINLAGNLSALGFSYIYSTQTLNITNSTITGTFKDRTGSAGALGQVLSSSVTGTQWITPVIPTLQQVLNAGSTATNNIYIKGKVYFEVSNESLDNFILYDPINGGNAIRYAADGGILLLQENGGNVGIGKTPNSAKLDILADSNNSSHIKLTENVNNYSWGITNINDDGDFVITDTDASNAIRFNIDKYSGIVTIGSSPINSALLNVRGDGYFSKNGGANITINSEDFGNSKLTLLSNSSGNKKAYIDAPLALGTLILQTQSIDRVTIGSTGNVWIGTTYSLTSNSAKLEVDGYSYFRGKVRIDVGEDTQNFVLYNGVGGINAIRYDGDATVLFLQETIDANNFVVIGTSATSGGTSKLQVTGGIQSDNYYSYLDDYSVNITPSTISMSDGDSNSYLTVNSTNINILNGGISLKSNLSGGQLNLNNLEVNAYCHYKWNGISMLYYNSDVDESYTSFNVSGNGNVSAFAYLTISDGRLKENIIPTASKLDDLMRVNVVNYNFINDKSKSQVIGVIAQEFEEVFPQLVNTNEEDIKSVNLNSLIPTLIKGMQEQQEIIKNLQTQIDKLK